MIAKLRGRVDQVGEDFAVIDVGGVGYLVFAGARTLAALAVGEAAELAIETHVREDHIHLYGFSAASEREMFRTLMTVQGVGAKVALAILSALSAQQIAQAIVSGDQGVFKRASGVGPKLAARLVAELKDKIAGFSMVAPLAKPAKGGPVPTGAEDAVSALVNLGYARMDAFGAVTRTLANAGGTMPLPALIRAALKELGSAHG
ncbi:MAG: Holliday junction branch migration protein RuvA [Rhodospirillaceae bacterium]|nr:Holliday junction branch migration protein RuvA [Rhodospirillaceae bacterium]